MAAEESFTEPVLLDRAHEVTAFDCSVGEALLKRLGQELAAEHGRGFSERNLIRMRAFYLGWEISPTPSAKFQARGKGSLFTDAVSETPLLPADFTTRAGTFPMSWSHYVGFVCRKPNSQNFLRGRGRSLRPVGSPTRPAA
jgi:DUF1016 N-terminal domain